MNMVCAIFSKDQLSSVKNLISSRFCKSVTFAIVFEAASIPK